MNFVCRYDDSILCSYARINQTETASLDNCKLCIEMKRVQALDRIVLALAKIGNIECGLKAFAKAIQVEAAKHKNN